LVAVTKKRPRTKDDDEDEKDWESTNEPLVLIRALSYDHLALSNQAETPGASLPCRTLPPGNPGTASYTSRF
jgi:hypothetical protein